MNISEAKVKVLTGVKDQDSIDLAIESAEAVLANCKCYPAARLDLLGAWVAAHFAASFTHTNAMVTSRSLGDASKSFGQAALSEDFRSTPFGSQALLLDFKGCLTSLGKAKASAEAF